MIGTSCVSPTCVSPVMKMFLLGIIVIPSSYYFQASSDRSRIRPYDESQRKQDDTKAGYRHGNSWYRVSGECLPGDESDNDDCRKGPDDPNQLTKSHYSAPWSVTNKYS